MRQLMRAVVIVAAASPLVWMAGPASPQTNAVKRCAVGKVTRVIDGKRSCVPVARYRQRATPPPTGALSALQQALAGGSTKLRLKTGAVARPALPAAVVRDIVNRYAASEKELRAAVPAALRQTGTARTHDIGATGATISKSADGSSATGSIGFGGTAGAYTVTGKMDLSANVSGRLDVGFDVTVTDPTGASKSNGITARDILQRNPECPDANGNLPLKGGYSVTTRSGETFGSKRVRLGQVREGTTQAVTSSTAAKFGPDGKAAPFTVRVTVSHDFARSASALAFFGARLRAVGSGSMTATVDPATGRVSKATVTTNGRLTGYGQGAAAGEGELRALMEKLLNDEVGRLLEAVRNAEKNCRGPFEVTLALKTDADFATHSASGTLNATLTATKNAAGEITGSVPISYQNLTFASKVGCAMIDPVSTTASFTATITIQADGLAVKWSAGDGSAGLSTSATVQCPATPPDPPPPPIPGQPGPRLMLPTPTEFTLPAAGGQRAIGGGFQDLNDGWTHTGTITVTPKPG